MVKFKQENFCDSCGNFIDGFFIIKNGKVYCDTCTSELIKEEMRKTGKIELYLNTYNDDWYVSDWLGNLKYSVIQRYTITKRIGKYKRIRKVLFKFEGEWWVGIQKGSISDSCQCRRIIDDKR